MKTETRDNSLPSPIAFGHVSSELKKPDEILIVQALVISVFNCNK